MGPGFEPRQGWLSYKIAKELIAKKCDLLENPFKFATLNICLVKSILVIAGV